MKGIFKESTHSANLMMDLTQELTRPGKERIDWGWSRKRVVFLKHQWERVRGTKVRGEKTRERDMYEGSTRTNSRNHV